MPALPVWIREHTFEILGAAIIGLLAYIGNEKLSSLDERYKTLSVKLEETSCKVNALSFEDRFQQFETESIGNSIDDLKIDSPQMEKLKFMKEAFAPIAVCEEGKKILAKISNTYDGLSKYVVHEYGSAIDYFGHLPNDRALTHQLLGAANQKRSQQFDPGSADQKVFRQARRWPFRAVFTPSG